MSSITFLASSKPFRLPMEIEEYNNRIFERIEDVMFFIVQPLHKDWKHHVEEVLSLPYLYEVLGMGNDLFLSYIGHHMGLGDVFEVLYVPNQHNIEYYINKMKEQPDNIEVNTGSYTYRTPTGFYQLNPKNWLEELNRKNYITPFGVTTFVKY